MIESTPSDATPTIDSTQTAPPTVETTTSVKDTLKSKTITVVAEPKKIASGNAQYFPNIDSGKKILCYFVPGCEHCRATAKELTEMRKKDPSFPPLYVLFMNEEAFLIPEFFKEAGATYPYKIIEIIPFWNTLGKNRDTPGVKYFWNGNEIKYYDGIKDNKFNGAELEKYIKKPYSELKK
jgi:hypothetical protein